MEPNEEVQALRFTLNKQLEYMGRLQAVVEGLQEFAADMSSALGILENKLADAVDLLERMKGAEER